MRHCLATAMFALVFGMAACGPKPQPPTPAPAPYDDMGDHSCACPPED